MGRIICISKREREVNDLKDSKYKGENRTWVKSLLVRCSYLEAKRARNYACPQGRFTVLGTTFFNCSRTQFEVLIVNL